MTPSAGEDLLRCTLSEEELKCAVQTFDAYIAISDLIATLLHAEASVMVHLLNGSEYSLTTSMVKGSSAAPTRDARYLIEQVRDKIASLLGRQYSRTRESTEPQPKSASKQ